MLLLLLNKMCSLGCVTRLERVAHEPGLEDLSRLRPWQDIAFLLVGHTFNTNTFFFNGHNALYHKGIVKMEHTLGGVAIPEAKTFTSWLTGWSEQGPPCQAVLSWPTAPAAGI